MNACAAAQISGSLMALRLTGRFSRTARRRRRGSDRHRRGRARPAANGRGEKFRCSWWVRENHGFLSPNQFAAPAHGMWKPPHLVAGSFRYLSGSNGDRPGDAMNKGRRMNARSPSTCTHTPRVSCWNPFDNYGGSTTAPPTNTSAATAGRPSAEDGGVLPRAKIGLVMFTVDSRGAAGARRRIPNEEICRGGEEEQRHDDRLRQHRPAQGQDGRARGARPDRGIHGVKGFKFHPTVQGFPPYDKMAWPIYEVIAEHKLPAIFHSPRGIGSACAAAAACACRTATRCCWKTWRSTSRHPDRRGAPAGRGRSARRCRWRCTSPTCGSTCRAGARNTFQAAGAVRQHAAEGPHAVRQRHRSSPERWMKDFGRRGSSRRCTKILKTNAMRLLGLS